jgi:hypothetical protein
MLDASRKLDEEKIQTIENGQGQKMYTADT